MAQGETSGQQPDFTQLMVQHELAIANAKYALVIEDHLFAYQIMDEALGIRDWINANTDTQDSIDTSFITADLQQQFLTSLYKSGQTELAESIAAERLHRTSDPYEAHGILLWASRALARGGNVGSGLYLAQSSLEIAEDIGSPWLAAQSHTRIGRIERIRGNRDQEFSEVSAVLDSIEAGESSGLYYPEKGIMEANYGAKSLAMSHMSRLFNEGRYRQLRHENMVLNDGSANRGRRAIYHYWMGRVGSKTAVRTEDWKLSEVVQPILHLADAEFLFSGAGEPVFAGHAILERSLLYGYVEPGLHDAKLYRRFAYEQWQSTHSGELAVQIANLDKRILKVERLFFSGRLAALGVIRQTLN